MKDVFTKIYEENLWKGQSRSGKGSDLDATAAIRAALPAIFERHRIHSVLDIPCGDFFWGKEVKWPPVYIGGDVVTELIVENQKNFPGVDFRVMNLLTDELPLVDLILCRDLLGHFSNDHLRRAIKNLKNSGAKWLLATTFPGRDNGNVGINTGEWRPINLSDWRLGLGAPMVLIDEECQEGDYEFTDKSLGLWRLRP